MVRGFVTGILAGGIVSALALAVFAVVAPTSRQQAPAVSGTAQPQEAAPATAPAEAAAPAKAPKADATAAPAEAPATVAPADPAAPPSEPAAPLGDAPPGAVTPNTSAPADPAPAKEDGAALQPLAEPAEKAASLMPQTGQGEATPATAPAPATETPEMMAEETAPGAEPVVPSGKGEATVAATAKPEAADTALPKSSDLADAGAKDSIATKPVIAPDVVALDIAPQPETLALATAPEAPPVAQPAVTALAGLQRDMPPTKTALPAKAPALATTAPEATALVPEAETMPIVVAEAEPDAVTPKIIAPLGEMTVEASPPPAMDAPLKADTELPRILTEDAPLTDTANATLAPEAPLSSDVAGVVTNRLPRIGDAPASDAKAAADAKPMVRFARDFDNPDQKPIFSIILIDTGAADLDRKALAGLPFAVSFALDPMDPKAADDAAIYRAAGQEVLMLASGIPEGATASDLEVSFAAISDRLPEAVAVLDQPEPVFQNDRPLATQVVPILVAEGRGLVTWDEGLNAADQVARREGLPSAMAFRYLDGAGENEATIRRYLDRAAFRAAQDGRVVVIGTTRPETVAALTAWGQEARAATVSLAPVTAALMVN